MYISHMYWTIYPCIELSTTVCMYVCMYHVQVSRFRSFSTNVIVATLSGVEWDVLRAFHQLWVSHPSENISDIQVLVTLLFLNHTHKTQTGIASTLVHYSNSNWDCKYLVHYSNSNWDSKYLVHYSNSNWDWKWVSNPLGLIKLSTYWIWLMNLIQDF
jgi:hypothetical protein